VADSSSIKFSSSMIVLSCRLAASSTKVADEATDTVLA